MQSTAMLRTVALILACVGMVIPAPIVQAALQESSEPKTVERAPQPIDVALRHGGVLFGQILDSQGTPQTKLPVSLLQADRKPSATLTDESGNFVLTGLRGGVYQVVAGETQGYYRLWAANTAPPSAQKGALLVVGKGPIRAQQGPLGYWLSNPWVIAGLVATAVAVPVAIHNHQIDRKKTPVSP